MFPVTCYEFKERKLMYFDRNSSTFMKGGYDYCYSIHEVKRNVKTFTLPSYSECIPHVLNIKLWKHKSKNFAWLFVIVSETKQMSLSRAHSMLQCSFKRKQDFLYSDTLWTHLIHSIATSWKDLFYFLLLYIIKCYAR